MAAGKAAFQYDVALSFAGEDREHAEGLASCLQKRGVRVFYDAHEQSTLWGKNLYQHLHDVYSQQARFCIVFVSAKYAERLSTNHELRAAQERAFFEKGEAYILPIRIDDTPIPGLPQTIAYVHIREGIRKICQLTAEKLQLDSADGHEEEREPPRPPPTERPKTNPFAEAAALLRDFVLKAQDLRDAFDRAAEAGFQNRGRLETVQLCIRAYNPVYTALNTRKLELVETLRPQVDESIADAVQDLFDRVVSDVHRAHILQMNEVRVRMEDIADGKVPAEGVEEAVEDARKLLAPLSRAIGVRLDTLSTDIDKMYRRVGRAASG